MCDDGFNLEGMMSRTCGPDGSWTSTAPTCNRTLSLVLHIQCSVFLSIAMVMYVPAACYVCLYNIQLLIVDSPQTLLMDLLSRQT